MFPEVLLVVTKVWGAESTDHLIYVAKGILAKIPVKLKDGYA